MILADEIESCTYPQGVLLPMMNAVTSEALVQVVTLLPQVAYRCGLCAWDRGSFSVRPRS